MTPPNFPRWDYFGIFKKCQGLGAAVESAYSCKEEDFTRELQRIFRLADELFEISTDSSILKAM